MQDRYYFHISTVPEGKIKESKNSVTSTAFGVDGIFIKMVRGLSSFCIEALGQCIIENW